MKTTYSINNLPIITGAEIAIVQSKWYREYTDKMVTTCLEVLAQAQAAPPQVHVISGCLEMPLCARRLLRKNPKLEALIAIGVILKGETFHFEMITQACMEGLSRVMFEEDIPIIVEVLPVTSLDQIIARSSDNEANKGIEAALAAAETIAWRREHPLH